MTWYQPLPHSNSKAEPLNDTGTFPRPNSSGKGVGGTANLGPGFDSIGLALGVFDVGTARVVAKGLHITVDGESAGVVPDVEPSLTASSGELVARVRSLLTVDILKYSVGGFGPHAGVATVVPPVDEDPNVGGKVLDGSERIRVDCLSFNDAEPDLDQGPDVEVK